MKRSKAKYVKCPCCLTGRHQTEMKTCLGMLDQLERQAYKHFKELKFDQYTYDGFLDSSFEWACDICLTTKKAVLAIPALQETPWTPHLAYADAKLKCSRCSKNFLFKKEEKKVWFETYKLPVDAEPHNCLDCRRNSRKQHLENKTISDILRKSEAEITNEELEKVVAIYASWDKMDKAKFYQSKLNKRKKDHRQHRI